jgi:hypothetical protein
VNIFVACSFPANTSYCLGLRINWRFCVANVKMGGRPMQSLRVLWWKTGHCKSGVSVEQWSSRCPFLNCSLIAISRLQAAQGWRLLPVTCLNEDLPWHVTRWGIITWLYYLLSVDTDVYILSIRQPCIALRASYLQNWVSQDWYLKILAVAVTYLVIHSWIVF